MMSYIVLNGRWCDSIVPNAHAPAEDTVLTLMTPSTANSQCVHPISYVTAMRKTYQMSPVAYPGILFERGGSTNSGEDRENGDLGAIAP